MLGWSEGRTCGLRGAANCADSADSASFLFLRRLLHPGSALFFDEGHFAFVADSERLHLRHQLGIVLVSSIHEQTRHIATEIKRTVNLAQPTDQPSA